MRVISAIVHCLLLSVILVLHWCNCVNNKNCSECQKQFLYTTCSSLVWAWNFHVSTYWTCNSMNNLLSYCGLFDAKKDLLTKIYLSNFVRFTFELFQWCLSIVGRAAKQEDLRAAHSYLLCSSNLIFPIWFFKNQLQTDRALVLKDFQSCLNFTQFCKIFELFQSCLSIVGRAAKHEDLRAAHSYLLCEFRLSA